MTQELKEIDFSDNAKIVLEKRYLSEGETSEERMWAMCKYVASAEQKMVDPATLLSQQHYWADKFYNELIVPKKFFPNSPTIVNAGSKSKKGGLQACNVISPQDTMESIFQTVKDWALTEKYGAGIGAYFGDIRPKGSPINTTHGKALGPIAVMKILSESSKWITQGSFREGAHIAILPIHHADISEFIHCKDNCKSPDDILHNFNISIQMTDNFMDAVANNIYYENEGLIGIWKEICESAWKTGDPGLFFIDRIRETEPNPQLGLIQSPNPCGEQPLENYNSCNLGSINLGKFVRYTPLIKEAQELCLKEDDTSITPIDWDSLKETIHLAVRFLDDVIDVNIFPEDVPQLNEMNQKTRRIGLGVMGWHDMLVKLNIPYESEEAINLAEELSSFLSKEAWIASLKLGEEKGEFPEWNSSELKKGGKRGTFVQDYDWISVGPRNSCVTTVAPTGTLNILADCSSGIEPYYSLYTERKTLWKEGEYQATIIEIPQILLDLMYQDKYCDQGSEGYIHINLVKTFINATKRVDLFKTALEISPEWHIKHQAAWQKHITNGISKTINLPNDATVKDISDAYILAWKLGCKGATVYRDGSKDVQVLNYVERAAQTLGETLAKGIDDAIMAPVPNQATEDKGLDQKIYPITRPEKVVGDTTRILTGHGKAYITVNSLSGTPIEVFCESGKAGKCDGATTEAITRLISLCLRSKIDPNEVVEQLRNITCCPIWQNGFQIMSLPDAISKVLHDHIKEEEGGYTISPLTETHTTVRSSIKDPVCIDCGGSIQYTEGCMKCQSCGWNKCE